METNMVEILKKMGKLNISYFVLRDYENIERVNNSIDVDILVQKKHLKEAIAFLQQEGFVLQKLSPNKFPHYQFKKISDRIYKFDVVTDFFYGINEYYLNLKEFDISLESVTNDFDIQIPNNELAVYTMLLHILFDKKEFSEKNYKIIKNMIKYFDYKKYNYSDLNEIIRFIQNSDIVECNAKVIEYRNVILKNNILKKYKLKYLKNIEIKTKKILQALSRRLKRTNLAVIGIDGSGKSTIIERIKNILGNDSVVIYMGLKNFKYSYCEKNQSLDNRNIFQKLWYNILLYLDFLGRYFKCRFTSKFVIFDRYVDDILANSSKSRAIFDLLFYKLLFPTPKIKYYLYCDAETSLSRKDDITDEENFRKSKNKYDKYVEKNKNIISLKTDEMSEDEVVQKIMCSINKIKY